jgi:hypothetical protein
MYILLTFSIIFLSVIFPFTHHKSTSSKNSKCLLRSKAGLIIRIYQPILFYAIPDLFLLSNLFTVYALCRRRQLQQKRFSFSDVDNEEKFEIRINDVHSNRKQRQLTIMLVTVSLSFYLFTTPAMIAYIREIQPLKHREINKFKQNILFSQISVLFLQLNNAVS